MCVVQLMAVQIHAAQYSDMEYDTIFIGCNWVSTWWQWSVHLYKKYVRGRYIQKKKQNQNNTKAQNTQNRKKNIQNKKTNIKRILENTSRVIIK